MNERDKELAEQVERIRDLYEVGPVQRAAILDFADLIRADEREACAVMADECANIEELGAAIRARGNT